MVHLQGSPIADGRTGEDPTPTKLATDKKLQNSKNSKIAGEKRVPLIRECLPIYWRTIVWNFVGKDDAWIY